MDTDPPTRIGPFFVVARLPVVTVEVTSVAAVDSVSGCGVDSSSATGVDSTSGACVDSSSGACVDSSGASVEAFVVADTATFFAVVWDGPRRLRVVFKVGARVPSPLVFKST